MATSIRQAQADLLNSGDLDKLGADFELTETEDALILAAAYLVEQAQNELSKGGHVSSGELSDSIVANDPKESAGRVSIDVEALFYYQFINKGVRGLKGGSGQYSFKTAYPSKDMVASIEKWMKRSGKASTNVNKKHTISANEAKNVSVSELDAAYAVAKSIKTKGIKASHFFDKAIELAENYVQSELGKSFTADIINALPESI